jgi:hypothetical protein
VLGEPETLLDDAPQAIARHGVSRCFHRDGKSDTRVREPIGFHAQTEETIVDAPAAGVNRIELQLAAKTQLSAKT